MLGRQPLPAQQRLDLAAAQLAAAHPSGCYYRSLLRAHRATGLLRACGRPGAAGDVAYAAAHLAPIKDCEVLVLGSGLDSPAFCRALHAALRGLVDVLGVQTFNLGVLNLGVRAARAGRQAGQGAVAGGWGGGALGARPVLARVVSRGKLSSAASDYGTLEVVGGASIGHTDPFRVIAAVEQQLGVWALDPQRLEL
jgi:hypothetical protein